jgi:Protein of unknown function (DUF1861)
LKQFDVEHLLASYRHKSNGTRGSLVTLEGIDGKDGYNPSAAFLDAGRLSTYVRVESRADEFSSWSAVFHQDGPQDWGLNDGLPMLRVQDACVSRIQGELIVGGVRILARSRTFTYFQTVFWRGDSPANLTEFARGPLQMKDIRLVDLENGKIGVFTRPMGGEAGRGKVGYTEVDGLTELTPEKMANAELLDVQPIDEHWWGTNAIYRLGDGRLGVLGHVAMFRSPHKHYYPFACVLDMHDRRIIDGPHIIAERSSFPPAPAKRDDLEDVVFPAWFDRGKGMLYAGLSDSSVGMLPIDDPFGR